MVPAQKSWCEPMVTTPVLYQDQLKRICVLVQVGQLAATLPFVAIKLGLMRAESPRQCWFRGPREYPLVVNFGVILAT